MLECVADAVEMQCCVEIRSPGCMQGVVRPLSLAARERQGAPPVLLAASRLADVTGDGDVVVIASGFYVPDAMPMGETDGPPGAAALARALSLGLGAVPLVLAERPTLEPIAAACRAHGLRQVAGPTAHPQGGSFLAEAFPTDESAQRQAEVILETHRPRAVIVTERPGINRKGVAHRGGGRAITQGRARVEVLLALARQAGVPVIAIGDNGNEAGMGLIADVVRQYKPYGARCLCPCEGGIAAVEEADVTVVGSVSNWAAYGITACLAVLLGDERLIHDAPTERLVIEESLRAGAVDGISLSRRPLVDGISAEINGAVVDILHTIVATALATEQR